ncbi:AAA family ATPase [Vibrio zhugei]|uniref:AAA family ATPase n=1 Tax=Vibrio zhugei TaxID=2479546 RepID=A0ABV7C3T6_9VIBR|nr:AAA family ATPase [Vibrio zhugei]
MIFGRKDISEVFTPRNSSVNPKMYIERKDLEKSLRRSINGSMHSFLFGESGTGKSWLYKKVFGENNIKYVVANCASASIKRSITNEILSVSLKAGSSQKQSYSESKEAGLSAGATAKLKHQGEYTVVQEDDLIKAFESLSKESGNKKTVLVFDNLETIFKNEELMDELSDIIILLDDERYAKYKVKFLIVGVPNEAIRYFSSSKSSSSVGNRIEEISRVTGFDYQQVLELFERGFVNQLKVELTETQTRRLAVHIFNITLGIPQRVHEYCEVLAYEIEDNDWQYNTQLIEEADQAWLLRGLRESYSTIEKYLNSDETSEGRRNQVIYALGKNSAHQIDTNKIGEIIRKEFPSTAPDSNSGIGQVLSFLSKGDNPVLHKISNSNAYAFTDPRYIMCIRIMLYKSEGTEAVHKKGFSIT